MSVTPEQIRGGYEHCVSSGERSVGHCSGCPIFRRIHYTGVIRPCISWRRTSGIDDWVAKANKEAVIRSAVEKYCDPLYVDLLKVKEITDGTGHRR